MTKLSDYIPQQKCSACKYYMEYLPDSDYYTCTMPPCPNYGKVGTLYKNPELLKEKEA